MTRPRRKRSRKRRRKLPQPPAPKIVEDNKANPPQVRRRVEAELHVGPLPAPELLAAYEKARPGLAGEIVQAWQGQSAHRQRVEQQIVDANISTQRWGLIFGWVLALITITYSSVLIFYGKGWIGLGLGVAKILALLVVRLRTAAKQSGDQRSNLDGLDR